MRAIFDGDPQSRTYINLGLNLIIDVLRTSLHGFRTIIAKSQGNESGPYLSVVCKTSRSSSDQKES